MIEYIKFRKKLSKLHRMENSAYESYSENIRKAREQMKPSLEIQRIESDARFDDQEISESISTLVTNYLIKKASRRFLAIPSIKEDGMWKRCEYISNRYVLTNKGISHLRSFLMKEKKELIEMIVPIVTAIAGLLGVATGFIAVVLK